MLAIGLAFAVAPWLRGFTGDARTLSLVIGSGSALLALFYLLSPAWRISIAVDDDGIEVLAKGKRRFRLAWTEVVKVVASDETKTCFVDGGTPARSLKVPGKGAPAAYAIEDRETLYQLIVSRTPPDRIEHVLFLEVEEAHSEPPETPETGHQEDPETGHQEDPDDHSSTGD